jgi:hypothetical protein
MEVGTRFELLGMWPPIRALISGLLSSIFYSVKVIYLLVILIKLFLNCRVT